MGNQIRKPAVAGSFYEGNKKRLEEQIKSCFLHPLGPGAIPDVSKWDKNTSLLRAVVCPHAGYMYSGPVAAWSYSKLAKNGIPKTIVLLGPNHRGHGSGVSVPEAGAWETPFGKVELHREILDGLCEAGAAERDDRSHAFEHSLEVQVPFLQFLSGSAFTLAPVSFLTQNHETARRMAEALHKLREKFDFIIVASSDMTHYETHERASQKDSLAISTMLQLNARGLEDVIRKNDISMCGSCPVMTAMEYSKLCGVTAGKMLKYATSGEISADMSRVVGYTAVAFYEESG